MRKSNDLSGVYRAHWKYKKTFYEGLAIVFHPSKNKIVGLEICADSNKSCGGLYFFEGKIQGKEIGGTWRKSDNLQCGRFHFSAKNKRWNGWYDHLSEKTKYNYTFNYLTRL